jgi:hypothetical protein
MKKEVFLALEFLCRLTRSPQIRHPRHRCPSQDYDCHQCDRSDRRHWRYQFHRSRRFRRRSHSGPSRAGQMRERTWLFNVPYSHSFVTTTAPSFSGLTITLALCVCVRRCVSWTSWPSLGVLQLGFGKSASFTSVPPCFASIFSSGCSESSSICSDSLSVRSLSEFAHRNSVAKSCPPR